MSIITGEAAAALKDFGEDFENGVLSVPGGKTADGQGGFKTAAPTSYPCKALVTRYSDYRRIALGIPATDRRVLILGGSLPAGIVPAKGMRITAPDPARGLAPATFDVIELTGDPAGAVYEVQAR